MNPEPDDDAHLRPPYPLPFRPPASFLDALIKQCDDAIETMARISETPSYFMTEDGRVGITPCEPRALNFRNAATMSISAKGVSLETLELLVGGGIVPLCERLIPSKGTE